MPQATGLLEPLDFATVMEPLFCSDFLNRLEAALDVAVADPRRVKLGITFVFKRGAGSVLDYEWTYYCFRKDGRFDLDVQGIDSGQMHVFVRSDRRKTMGKVLMRLEYLTIPMNPGILVEAVFDSLETLAGSDSDSNEMKAVSRVREIWEGISFRVVE
jgi:hypothetical protein